MQKMKNEQIAMSAINVY